MPAAAPQTFRARTALQSLRKLILEDARLAPAVSGVFLRPPEGSALPYAIISRISHSYIPTTGRALAQGINEEVLEVAIYAASDDAAESIQSAWRSALSAPTTRLPIEGDRFRGMMLLNERGPDRVGEAETGINAADVFTCSMDYQIHSVAEV